MATPTDIVRSIIQDKPLFQADSVYCDGSEKVAQVQYFPIIGSTVTVTPDLGAITYTIDEQNGVLTFSEAPSGTYSITYKHVFLLDEDIENLFTLGGEGADIRLCAADALDAIASSQALILKKIKLLDLQTDGPAVADALRKHAKGLRDQVLQVLELEGDESCFDIAEQIYNRPTWIEKIYKDIMRES